MKPTFNKLGLKLNTEVTKVTFKDQEIEIKQYLPVEEKLKLISNVINLSADENNFANPIKLKIFLDLEILYTYTNISFTEKQKEDPAKLYDILQSSGFFRVIFLEIPDAELNSLVKDTQDAVAAVYSYKNSAFGIMENIVADYKDVKLDAEEIQKTLESPTELTLVKEIVNKLG